jgi:hypothetical protein
MYQQLNETMANGTVIGTAECIKRLADNAFIPFDPANTDFQEYQRWLSEGNEPLPPDEPESE